MSASGLNLGSPPCLMGITVLLQSRGRNNRAFALGMRDFPFSISAVIGFIALFGTEVADQLIIRTVTNAPIPMDVQTSAMSFFSESTSKVSDNKVTMYYVNHLEHFNEAEKRIQRALRRANKTSGVGT